MLFRLAHAFGEPCAIACDARCDKAWGISTRPQVRFSDNDDDTAYLADDELGIAPEDPGTSEGGHSKPRKPEERLNKWCFRECERCLSTERSVETLPDFSSRVYNIPATKEMHTKIRETLLLLEDENHEIRAALELKLQGQRTR